MEREYSWTYLNGLSHARPKSCQAHAEKVFDLVLSIVVRLLPASFSQTSTLYNTPSSFTKNTENFKFPRNAAGPVTPFVCSFLIIGDQIGILRHSLSKFRRVPSYLLFGFWNSSNSDILAAGRSKSFFLGSCGIMTGKEVRAEWVEPSVGAGAIVVPEMIVPVGRREPPNDTPSMSTVAQEILSGDNPASTLSVDEFSAIQSLYGLPSSKVCLPMESWRPDWIVREYVCFYEISFKLGLRFPLPDFITNVLNVLGIAPSQLMPNAWRILLGMLTLGETDQVETPFETLFCSYIPKLHDREDGRVLFHSKGKEPIIRVPSKNDLGDWKRHYFFVESDFVFGGLGDRGVPLYWQDVNDFVKVPAGYLAQRVYDKFLLHTERERSSAHLLEAQVLVRTELWSTVVASSNLSPEEYLESFREKMDEYPILSARELYGGKGRKRKKITTSSVQNGVEEVVGHVAGTTLSVPLGGTTPLVELGHGIQTLRIRDEASLVQCPRAFGGEELKLLLPKDRCHFENIGPSETASYAIAETLRGAQAVIKLGDDIKSLLSEVERLKIANASLQKEKEGLERKVSGILQRAESAEGDLQKLRSTLGVEKGRAHKIGFMTARLEAMLEYKNGMSNKWKPIREIKDWRRQLRISSDDGIGNLDDEPLSDGESGSEGIEGS